MSDKDHMYLARVPNGYGYAHDKHKAIDLAISSGHPDGASIDLHRVIGLAGISNVDGSFQAEESEPVQLTVDDLDPVSLVYNAVNRLGFLSRWAKAVAKDEAAADLMDGLSKQLDDVAARIESAFCDALRADGDDNPLPLKPHDPTS